MARKLAILVDGGMQLLTIGEVRIEDDEVEFVIDPEAETKLKNMLEGNN